MLIRFENLFKSYFIYADFSSQHDSLDKFIHLTLDTILLFNFSNIWVGPSWKTTYDFVLQFLKHLGRSVLKSNLWKSGLVRNPVEKTVVKEVLIHCWDNDS